MAGTPKRREARGLDPHPFKSDPYWGDPKQRPPFEPGNTDSVIHGAQSERLLAPLAAEIEAQLVRDAPWTARPAFAAARRAYAIAEARCIRYREFFDGGELDEDGEPRTGVERWQRAEDSAARLRRRLSLDVSEFACVVTKLARVEPGDGRARAELDALRDEITAIDEEIAAVKEQKELER